MVKNAAAQPEALPAAATEITQWARPHVRGSASGQHLTLRTSRGSERAHPGDWVVKGESGRFGLVTAEVFSETYEVTPE